MKTDIISVLRAQVLKSGSLSTNPIFFSLSNCGPMGSFLIFKFEKFVMLGHVYIK